MTCLLKKVEGATAGVMGLGSGVIAAGTFGPKRTVLFLTVSKPWVFFCEYIGGGASVMDSFAIGATRQDCPGIF